MVTTNYLVCIVHDITYRVGDVLSKYSEFLHTWSRANAYIRFMTAAGVYAL